MRGLIDAWQTAQARGEAVVLATVVGVEGSGYRRPGARLLLTTDGETIGTISGGCVEHDLARRGWWLSSAGPTIVSYDASTIDDGVADAGSGCGGVISVLLERLAPGDEPHPLHLIEAVGRARRRGVVLTVLADESGTIPSGRHGLVFPDSAVSCALGSRARRALRAVAKQALDESPHGGVYTTAVAGLTVLVEVVAPAPALVIFGTDADAHALTTFAKNLGWDVSIVGCHASRTRRERFPRADRVIPTRPDDVLAGVPFDTETAVAVMTHSLTLDAAILRALRAMPLRYLGLLGPRHRAERVLAQLSGIDAVALARLRARLHSPIGLDIGAEGPAEIALAIVGEIRAVLAGRAGGTLRDRRAPLHDERAVLPSPDDPRVITTSGRSPIGRTR